MNQRFVVGLALLVVAALACGPLVGPKGSTGLSKGITDLSVDPTFGSGPFTLTVKYDVLASHEFISCFFEKAGTTGQSQHIGFIQDVLGPAALVFTETLAGDYEANCFEPGSHPILYGKPAKFTVGIPSLTFDFDKATSSDPANSPRPEFGCTPGEPGADYTTNYLKVSDTGVLDGKCTLKEPGYLYEGTLTGTWDTKARTVTFHLVTTEVNTSVNGGSTQTYNLVFDGSGALSTDTHAAGDATWTATCKAVGDVVGNGVTTPEICGHDANLNDLTSWTANGTVPFTMVAGH